MNADYTKTPSMAAVSRENLGEDNRDGWGLYFRKRNA